MPRSLSRSRSPPRKGRHRSSAQSPSPASHRHSTRRRRETYRSRSPVHHGHSRHRSRTPTLRRSKRRSRTRSPLRSRSTSPVAVDRRRAFDKVREDEELEKRSIIEPGLAQHTSGGSKRLKQRLLRKNLQRE